MDSGISHEVEAALAVISVAMFVGTAVAVPIFLVRVPDDYFASRASVKRSRLRRVLTSIVGLLLVTVGVAMLVLPGQGILTIVVGLAILELPFKDRAVARLLAYPKIGGAIDALRRRAGKGALVVPSAIPSEGE